MLDRIEHHSGVMELRMNRPPVNAMDPSLVLALREAVSGAPRDGARALIISGREGMYSAGLDVPALLQLEIRDLQAFVHDFFSMLRAVAASEIPVVAAITGHSPAGGAVLSCFCDWRVMAQGDFRFGYNEVAVGLVVPAFARRAVARMAGPECAERVCTEARMMAPEEVLRHGLVHELAPIGEVVSRALGWCERILKLPSRAMLLQRRIARADLLAGFDDLPEEVEMIAELWGSEETQRSLRAMIERLEKRAK